MLLSFAGYVLPAGVTPTQFQVIHDQSVTKQTPCLKFSYSDNLTWNTGVTVNVKFYCVDLKLE